MSLIHKCFYLSVFAFCSVIVVSAQEKEKKPVQLNTVNVKGSRNPLKETAKGAVLDISKLADAKLLTLSEILRTIPGIEVGDNGKISYMGKDLTLLRDGVDVAGFSSQLANSLNSANIGTNYTKIELNLYNLKTEGPTLSFVAPKYDEGYYGGVMANTGLNSSTASSNINFVRAKYSVNVVASGNLQYAPTSTSKNQTYFTQTQTQENRESSTSGVETQGYQFSFNNSFLVNTKNTINASVSYGSSAMNYSMVNSQLKYQNGVLNNSSVNLLESKNPIDKNPRLGAKISYIYKPKATETVNQRFDMALEYDNNQTLNQNEAKTESLLGVFLPFSNYLSLNATKYKNIFGLIGYEYNHAKLGDFEFVARYFNRKNTETYDFNYLADAVGSIENLFQNNDIAYNYGALLASWSKSFAGISLRTVIKQDYSNDYISNLKGRDGFKFSTFSPYLSLQRTLKNGSIRFEAQFSQRRPALTYLSNIISYGAQYNNNNAVTVGNTYLKPSKSLYFSTVYNTNIKSVNVVFAGNYEHVTDAISTFETTDGNNIRIRTYRNLAVRDEYRGDISFNFYLFPRCTLQLFNNNNFGQYTIDDGESKNTYRWSNGFRLNFTPVPNIRLGTSAGISGGNGFQTKTKAQFNSGLTASYLKNKTNFTLTVNSFHRPYFNTYNWVYGNGYQTYSESRSRRLMCMLNFTYSFGKVTKRAGVEGKDIKKDDM